MVSRYVVDGVAEACAAVMQHSSGVQSIVGALCNGTSSSAMLLKDAFSLLRTLLVSPHLSISMKVPVLRSLLGCAVGGGAAPTESPNIERSIMVTSMLHMFFIDAQQPLPLDCATDVAALATDSLIMVIHSNDARDVRKLSLAASQTLQLQSIAILLICLPVPSTNQSSAESQSSLQFSSASPIPPPPAFPSDASLPRVTMSLLAPPPALFRVANDGFVTLVIKAVSVMIKQGESQGQHLMVKEYLRLLHRIALCLPPSSSCAARELEDCIPEFFDYISIGKTTVQHGTIECLLSMLQRGQTFPNAVRKFLEVDGFKSIIQMMKAVAAKLYASSSFSSSSSWTSSESESCIVLTKGAVHFTATMSQSHSTRLTSAQDLACLFLQSNLTPRRWIAMAHSGVRRVCWSCSRIC